MAIAGASRAYSFCDGRLVLSGEIVPILYYPDADEVWMRAKQIHTFTGAKNMTHTLQRVDENDKVPEGAPSAQRRASKGWYVEHTTVTGGSPLSVRAGRFA
jgi:hypothetical protein